MYSYVRTYISGIEFLNDGLKNGRRRRRRRTGRFDHAITGSPERVPRIRISHSPVTPPRLFPCFYRTVNATRKEKKPSRRKIHDNGKYHAFADADITTSKGCRYILEKTGKYRRIFFFLKFSRPAPPPPSFLAYPVLPLSAGVFARLSPGRSY